MKNNKNVHIHPAIHNAYPSDNFAFMAVFSAAVDLKLRPTLTDIPADTVQPYLIMLPCAKT